MAQNKSIFIKVSVDNKQSTKEIGKSKSSVDALAGSVDRLTGEQREAAIVAEVKAKKRQLLQKEIKAEAASRLALDKSIKRNKTNAGLNNAIIAESARLASDASFGFTAIANNLGQLVSLFSASANAAGGLVSAFRALISVQSLFLIGIQLAITYGDRIYNFFFGTEKAALDAAKGIKEATKSIDDIILRFNQLSEINTSGFEFFGVDESVFKTTERLRNEFSDFAIGYDKLDEKQKNNKESLALLIRDYEDYIRAQKNAAAAQKALEQATTLDPETGRPLDPNVPLGVARISYVKNLRKEFLKQYDLTLLLGERFKSELEKQKKEGDVRIKVFDAQFLELDKIEEKYRKKSVDRSQLTSEEVLGQIQQDAFTELDIKEELLQRYRRQG